LSAALNSAPSLQCSLRVYDWTSSNHPMLTIPIQYQLHKHDKHIWILTNWFLVAAGCSMKSKTTTTTNCHDWWNQKLNKILTIRPMNYPTNKYKHDHSFGSIEVEKRVCLDKIRHELPYYWATLMRHFFYTDQNMLERIQLWHDLQNMFNVRQE
jgi:hypothetical protein